MDFKLDSNSKLLDARTDAGRKIIDKIYPKSHGVGYFLPTERGLPDFTDTGMLVKKLKEKGMDYDAIVFDDRGERGVGYVVLNKKALKKT